LLKLAIESSDAVYDVLRAAVAGSGSFTASNYAYVIPDSCSSGAVVITVPSCMFCSSGKFPITILPCVKAINLIVE